MGRIIPGMLDQVGKDLDVKDIDAMFAWYGKRKENGSVEGIGRIANNIAIAFGDFIIRTGSNIKITITGMFKDLKRSALRVFIASNKLGMIRVFGSDYTQLQPVICSSYPFTLNCKTVGMYCKDAFEVIGMNKRLVTIIEEYMHLGAAIKTGDIGSSIAIMNRINVLNMKEQNNIKDTLTHMVASQSTKNYTTFGEVFDSVTDYREAIDIALQSADELDVAIKADKLLDALYRSYEKLKDSITHASTTNFDLSKLSGIAGIIYDTGDLIESYALLVREYHHLEMFLTNVSEACLKTLKSN